LPLLLLLLLLLLTTLPNPIRTCPSNDAAIGCSQTLLLLLLLVLLLNHNTHSDNCRTCPSDAAAMGCSSNSANISPAGAPRLSSRMRSAVCVSKGGTLSCKATALVR
jgi:hypothetical protein